jgi:ABC-type dipeptide/oligopeptide/nickel transport system permease subunit
VSSGAYWLVLFPSAALIVTVLCVNFLGDGLRDALDPTQSIERR